jgi:hypothetical protein
MRIIYKGVLLNSESKAKLMGMIPPMFDDTFYHHVTIEFGLKEMGSDVGLPVDLQVIGYKSDDKAQAVVVSGVSRKDGGIAHITLSVAPGVKPSYSNTLLNSGYDAIHGPTLHGVIGVFTDTGWITNG